MTISVRDFLGLSVMRDARVVAGEVGLDAREVSWVAVIEGEAEDFVQEGEVVLTAGIGYEKRGICDLVAEVIASRAAAMCVGVAPGRYVEHIDDSARSLADREAFPLIEIPWEFRFADITRAAVDCILADRHGSVDAEDDRSRFTSIVLEGRGFVGLADALELVLRRGIVILDADLRPDAFGRRARAVLGDEGVESCRAASERLSAEGVDEMGSLFSDEGPRQVPELLPLGLGAGLGMAVAAQGGIVAYVDALDAEADESSANEFAALTLSRAAEAVTIEAARRRAATEAESRVRGHFLWSLASGTMDPDADIAGDASLLGYNPRGAHHVVVIEADERPGAKELERRLGRQGRHLELSFHTARRGTTLLLLIEADSGSEGIARRVLEELQAKRSVTKEAGFAAGIADGAWALRDLASAYAVAQRTLEIGRSIVGVHCVAHACDFGPFLMISHLADDPQANDTALSTLGPLIAYDRKTGRDLVETLETYFEEGQNATRTASRLFLSRHALLYRVKKIEQLTKLSLRSRDDRFVLELSLRLFRFGVLDVDQPPR